MNSTVSDGKEYTIVGKTEIIRFIEKLVDAGISSITITTPFLIRLVKKYFPELRIVASICAEIESVQKAQDFVDLGVDCIVPAKDVNRNFSLLRQMVELPIEIKLLATTPCLYKCSDILYQVASATASSSYNYSRYIIEKSSSFCFYVVLLNYP